MIINAVEKQKKYPKRSFFEVNAPIVIFKGLNLTKFHSPHLETYPEISISTRVNTETYTAFTTQIRLYLERCAVRRS